MTRPALLYDYTCFADGILYLNKKYLSDVKIPRTYTITNSEYFLFKWRTVCKSYGRAGRVICFLTAFYRHSDLYGGIFLKIDA